MRGIVGVLCGFDAPLYLASNLKHRNHEFGHKLIQQPNHKNINRQINEFEHVSKVAKIIRDIRIWIGFYLFLNCSRFFAKT